MYFRNIVFGMDLEDIEAQLVAERLKNEKLMDILKKQEQTIKVI